MKKWIIGLLIIGISQVWADTLYVSLSGSNTYPYKTAGAVANTIQAAVNAAAKGDTVLVFDGVYKVGTTATPSYSLSNRVVIEKNITVRSYNKWGAIISGG